MSFLKEVKQNNRRIPWGIVIVIAIIAVVGTGAFFLLKSDFFYKKIDTSAKEYKVTAEMNSVMQESELQTGYMFSRMSQVLSENRGIEPWLLSWVVVPGTTRSVPGYQSQYVDAFEQVLLLENYILSGKKSDAEKLMKAIDAKLMNEEGLLVNFAKPETLDVDTSSATATYEHNDEFENSAYVLMEQPAVSMQASTTYLRALMDYYDKWGNEALLKKIEELAEHVFAKEKYVAYRAADQMARPTPLPVSEILDVTPTPSPTPSEGEPENKLVQKEGIELAAMDLDALRRASALFPRFQDKYESILKKVQEGRVSDSVPLYAWMYVGDGNYTYYSGSRENVELVPSLYTIVHLAEVGKMDQSAYAWVSSKIYNGGFLYTHYSIFDGEADSSVEAVEAYPLVLRLAVIAEDESLFKATYQVMMRKYSTLDTSQVLYTFFRSVADQRIALYARENLLLQIFLR